jgi:hypothetical protein
VDHSALMVAARVLTMRLFGDAELKRLTGMTLAGSDLVTPEGNYFFVSASLRPEARFEDVRESIMAALKEVAANNSNPAAMIGRQLGDSLVNVPDPETLKSQMPAHVTPGMIEGNVGLQFGMHAHRYGEQRAALAERLSKVSADNVREAVRNHLSAGKAAVCTLSSEAAATGD